MVIPARVHGRVIGRVHVIEGKPHDQVIDPRRGAHTGTRRERGPDRVGINHEIRKARGEVYRRIHRPGTRGEDAEAVIQHGRQQVRVLTVRESFGTDVQVGSLDAVEVVPESPARHVPLERKVVPLVRSHVIAGQGHGLSADSASYLHLDRVRVVGQLLQIESDVILRRIVFVRLIVVMR